MKELTKEEQKEADAIAEIARRAEERAEQRALERAMQERKRQRETLYPSSSSTMTTISSHNKKEQTSRIVFVSKRSRQEKLKELQSNTKEKKVIPSKKKEIEKVRIAPRSQQEKGHLSDAMVSSVKRNYLGASSDPAEKKNRDNNNNKDKKKKNSKKTLFKFEWDASDDTTGQQEYGGLEDLYGNISLPKSRSLQRAPGASLTNSGAKDEDVMTKPLSQMTTRDWRIFRENYNIIVRGGGVPPPLRRFDDVKLAKELTYAIRHVCGYKDPSPIQRQAIPIGLQHRDILGIAETGSGKTAAFGIPLCEMVLTCSSAKDVAEEGPLALVLAPTRELALQIHVEISKLLSSAKGIETTSVVGGQSIQNQAMELRKGVHIVVGTPGRLNDCLDMRYLVLNQCNFIVLDEADRMIDLGFAPQMESILDSMCSTSTRVTAMFSATMPAEVERLAKKYLRQPAIVSIGGNYDGETKNARIQQRVIYLPSPQHKEGALRDLISNSSVGPNEKILVFVNEKKHTEGVARMIERTFVGKVVILHGGKTQEQRLEALEAFKQQRGNGVIMVATDVAGRGLDIPNVTHVINFNVPQRSIDAYCHRIGRTGRAGKHGLATSFVTDEDESILPALVSYLEQTNMPIPDRLLRHPSILSNQTTNFQ